MSDLVVSQPKNTLLGFIDPRVISEALDAVNWNAQTEIQWLYRMMTDPKEKTRNKLVAYRFLHDLVDEELLRMGAIRRVIGRGVIENTDSRFEVEEQTFEMVGSGSDSLRKLLSAFTGEKNAQREETRQLPSGYDEIEGEILPTGGSTGDPTGESTGRDAERGYAGDVATSDPSGFSQESSSGGDSESDPGARETGGHQGGYETNIQPSTRGVLYGRRPPTRQLIGGGLCDRRSGLPGKEASTTKTGDPGTNLSGVGKPGETSIQLENTAGIGGPAGVSVGRPERVIPEPGGPVVRETPDSPGVDSPDTGNCKGRSNGRGKNRRDRRGSGGNGPAKRNPGKQPGGKS